MQTKYMWLIVISLGIIIAILLAFLIVLPAKAPEDNNLNFNPPCCKSTGPFTKFGIYDLLEVSTPTPNTPIKSPLTVTGRARGSWFFEGSFLVAVFDANGKKLGENTAMAKSEWTTSDFVSFEDVVVFGASQTATGTLTFYRDNPSGLPQYDKKFEMTIRFK